MKFSCLPAICFALCLVGTASSEKTSEKGICKARFHRFFYNATSDECEQFIYGGCQGNDNNFETTEICLRVCRSLVNSLKRNGTSNEAHGMKVVKEERW
ncbi:hypothetical protein MC885_012162 [Smutsia gigantea]|nr:hypothetical protein MC885_012162 [Smutsia gigantea]